MTHYIFNFICALFNIFSLKKYLHIYQLKSYNNIRYFKYFKIKKSLFFLFCLLVFIFELLLKDIIFFIIANFILFILNMIYIKNLIKSVKTPLIYTKKLSRLYIFSIFILLCSCIYKHSFPLIFILSFLSPVISNCMNFYDQIKNKIFIYKASLKLETSRVKIIAITGSNGKTSVKNILLKMLETKYKVQASPASYNTPLGIAKFINEDLKKDTKFIILEYGARHKNDIKKLCNLFGADYGIVTTISPQHLESFKSLNNVFNAKNQLPQFLQNNLCIFNVDNLLCRQMFLLKTGKKFSTSIYEQAHIYAKDIKFKENKTFFELIINKKKYSCSTQLLGRHNISNICLAASLAKFLNVSNKNIIETIKKLIPVDHRLQLIQTHINILDDSYNCSPESAKEALHVLQNFKGKKMIVTPGIIECGKQKYNINFELGQQIAFCDFCVIVGKENQKSILRGLNSSQRRNNNLQTICVDTLQSAKDHFRKLDKGDTLLLLNDLPDDYQ